MLLRRFHGSMTTGRRGSTREPRPHLSVHCSIMEHGHRAWVPGTPNESLIASVTAKLGLSYSINVSVVTSPSYLISHVIDFVSPLGFGFVSDICLASVSSSCHFAACFLLPTAQETRSTSHIAPIDTLGCLYLLMRLMPPYSGIFRLF
jgi:hypothetical protein